MEFDHRLFITELETDSIVFFPHGSLVLKYADSSTQRDFFCHGSLVLEKSPNQTSQIRVTAKNFKTRANLFSSVLFPFSWRVCF